MVLQIIGRASLFFMFFLIAAPQAPALTIPEFLPISSRDFDGTMPPSSVITLEEDPALDKVAISRRYSRRCAFIPSRSSRDLHESPLSVLPSPPKLHGKSVIWPSSPLLELLGGYEILLERAEVAPRESKLSSKTRAFLRDYFPEETVTIRSHEVDPRVLQAELSIATEKGQLLTGSFRSGKLTLGNVPESEKDPMVEMRVRYAMPRGFIADDVMHLWMDLVGGKGFVGHRIVRVTSPKDKTKIMCMYTIKGVGK